ncbi:hypothetical protein [Oryzicola mucosus]|uniref:Uncharacterized protein n=1 Tax=Oryzicola mucosus TaxID=2767425 RepID=A0A8J6Q1B2_9HYPH|nr:hypothetical protein [Oryzicola mucosus]MBD0414545.1 hypothetical protein [Oryzicola mucosus]
MRNLTISIADDLMQETERKAAETGRTASQYVADLLKSNLANAEQIANSETKRRLEALQRIFDGPMWDVTENGRMPTAEERNARR